MMRFSNFMGGRTIQFRVRDPGNGFDHQKYMTLDPERMFDNHGRGIAMGAVFAFDQIIYNDKGNEVTATIKVTP